MRWKYHMLCMHGVYSSVLKVCENTMKVMAHHFAELLSLTHQMTRNVTVIELPQGVGIVVSQEPSKMFAVDALHVRMVGLTTTPSSTSSPSPLRASGRRSRSASSRPPRDWSSRSSHKNATRLRSSIQTPPMDISICQSTSEGRTLMLSTGIKSWIMNLK